ncbi:MAG: hypothetical protein KBS86_01855 [Proteobacteria bacterium]|nr:hypothetical protein [Candidatus Enterousia scatequi]
MKKILLAGLTAGFVCFSANASDGGFDNYVIGQKHMEHSVKPCNHCNKPCPCKKARPAKPVRVKTYTEVIDHYQLYQPVVVYQPAGTYSERRIEPAHKCTRCGF